MDRDRIKKEISDFCRVCFIFFVIYFLNVYLSSSICNCW